MKVMKKRKGFTLAELLIVITVIGVLASMMMVSSNEAVSTSRATDIIANLRAIKGAALMHYVDSMDTYSKTERAEDEKFNLDKVRKYIDVAGLSDNGYRVYEDDNGKWYVGYVFNKNDNDIIPKLAARAKTLGLLKATSDTDGLTIPAPSGGTGEDGDDGRFFESGTATGGFAVAMLVR